MEMKETVEIDKKEYEELKNYKEAYKLVFKGVSDNANKMVRVRHYGTNVFQVPTKYRAKIVEETLAEVRKLMRKALEEK